MTEFKHLLRPGGWRMTFKSSKNKVCSELLPDTGTTILIGLPGKGKGCSVVWMDRTGVLRTINSLVQQEDHWETKVKYNGKSYVITVAERPASSPGSPAAIGGTVMESIPRTGKVGKPPGGPYEVQGTWGAEANPGGGKG